MYKIGKQVLYNHVTKKKSEKEVSSSLDEIFHKIKCIGFYLYGRNTS